MHPIVRGFPGGSDSKESACNIGDPGSISELGRSPGEGNGNPLQYPCLGNPMVRGVWQATVHGVTRVRHDLATKDIHTHHIARYRLTMWNSCQLWDTQFVENPKIGDKQWMHQNALTEAVCLIFPKENMNRKKQRQSKVGGGGVRETLAQESYVIWPLGPKIRRGTCPTVH